MDVFNVKAKQKSGWMVVNAPECPAFEVRDQAQKYADLRNDGFDHGWCYRRAMDRWCGMEAKDMSGTEWSEYTAQRGKDDIFWNPHRRQVAGDVYGQYRAVRDELVDLGLWTMYGGTKGDGFWITQVWRKTAGSENSNRAFWSIPECWDLIRELKSRTVYFFEVYLKGPEGQTGWTIRVGYLFYHPAVGKTWREVVKANYGELFDEFITGGESTPNTIKSEHDYIV